VLMDDNKQWVSNGSERREGREFGYEMPMLETICYLAGATRVGTAGCNGTGSAEA
jgi:hypothetical protein